ncbi:hypothetical protein DPEC_G00016760 [Dallia pectoralis]|uniref:Uncharacterized protein n=1 Tax=Dallia pectoralis TaxID=75939 RepID=A0ACC2HNM8_DALPE|nr:hypothetical protein DPEC_G00016760 [Dallia pectoralis]
MAYSKLPSVAHTANKNQISEAILLLQHLMDPIVNHSHNRGIVSPDPQQLLNTSAFLTGSDICRVEIQLNAFDYGETHNVSRSMMITG